VLIFRCDRETSFFHSEILGRTSPHRSAGRFWARTSRRRFLVWTMHASLAGPSRVFLNAEGRRRAFHRGAQLGGVVVVMSKGLAPQTSSQAASPYVSSRSTQSYIASKIKYQILQGRPSKNACSSRYPSPP
jgi:hypothetical protein